MSENETYTDPRIIKTHRAIREAFVDLLHEKPFAQITVQDILERAPVNRSTFYKYYSGKNALVQELFAEQKEQVRNRLEGLLAHQCSLEEAAAALFAIQRESMAELYSAPVLDDIANVADLELERFFRSMEEEKYQFMRSFFHTLQQRKLIHHSLPPELIDLFIRQMDSLMRHPDLAELYAPTPQRLPQDILQLLLYGLTSREAE